MKPTLSPVQRALCSATLWITLCLAILPSPARGAVVLHDFNTTGSFSSDFTLLNDQYNYWSQPMTSGLNNSGNLQIGSSGSVNSKTSAAVAKEGISTSETQFTLSVYFQAREAASAGYQWMIGIVPTASTAPSVKDTEASIQLAVGLAKGSSGFRWAEYNNTTIGGKNADPPTYSFDLTAGNWYYFEADFERTGNVWTISYSIHHANANGTLPPLSLIASTESSFTNVGISAGTQFHPFLAVANNPTGRGVNRFDNFSVTTIPEPGTLPSLAVGLLLLFGVIRRLPTFHSRS